MSIPGGLIATLNAFISTAAQATVAAFKSIVTLLGGNGTDGLSNSSLLDSSANALTITAVGTPGQGSHSPFGTNWCNTFVPGYLSLPTGFTTAFGGFANKTYTIEAWVNPSLALANTRYPIIGSYAAVSVEGRWWFGIRGTGTSGVYTTTLVFTTNGVSGVEVALNSTTTSTIGKWTHIAAVIDATTPASTIVVLYIDGVGTTFTSQNMSTQTVAYDRHRIGGDLYNAALAGPVSNLRIVNSLVFPGDFTPSTTPLTAIANTLLLTCNSNRFVDKSSNAWALTLVSAPKVSKFGPFPLTTTYNATTHGASMVFNGSSDYAYGPTANAAFGFGTGDFTIECWFFCTLSKATSGLLDTRASGAASQTKPSLFLSSTTLKFVTSSTDRITTPIVLNQWNHVALVRSAGVTKMYLNGVASATTFTDSTNYGSTGDFVIGQQGDARSSTATPFTGYISNARTVKNAVYTSNFTSPTAPLTAITDTTALLLGANSGVFDSTGSFSYEAIGGCSISAAQSRFGAGSISLNGSTGYLKADVNNAELNISHTFTIESWVRFNVLPTTGNIAIIAARYGATSMSFRAGIYNNSGQIQTIFSYSTNGSTVVDHVANITLTTGTWYHVAFVRSGANLYMFLNGSLLSTSSMAGDVIFTGTEKLTVGATSHPNSFLNGYIDDFRITKAALYTANFAPPGELPTH